VPLASIEVIASVLRPKHKNRKEGFHLKLVASVANEHGWRVSRVAGPFGHHWRSAALSVGPRRSFDIHKIPAEVRLTAIRTQSPRPAGG